MNEAEVRDIQEENLYFRALLNLHPTLPVAEQRGLVLRNADAVMRGPERATPADHWEYQCIEDTDFPMQNQLGRQGWEAYAAALTPDRTHLIWMKRRLP